MPEFEEQNHSKKDAEDFSPRMKASHAHEEEVVDLEMTLHQHKN